MLLATTWWRRLETVSAADTWSTTLAALRGMRVPPELLDDQLGVQRAGGLESLEHRDDVARAGAQPRQGLYQVGNGSAALRDQRGAAGLLQVDARIAHQLGADARARVGQQRRLRHGVVGDD